MMFVGVGTIVPQVYTWKGTVVDDEPSPGWFGLVTCIEYVPGDAAKNELEVTCVQGTVGDVVER